MDEYISREKTKKAFNLDFGSVMDAVYANRVVDSVPAAFKWISVSDRLPEKYQDVLMYFRTGNMAAGFWTDKDESKVFWSAYTDDGWYTDCDFEPLFWAELPEKPEV